MAHSLKNVVVVGGHPREKFGKLEVPDGGRDGGGTDRVQQPGRRGQGAAEPRSHVACLHVAPRDESVEERELQLSNHNLLSQFNES